MLRHLPAFLALGLVLACASPTLPLPPPESPAQQAVDAAHVTLSSPCGGVEDNATVNIHNLTRTDPNHLTGETTQADGCGAWFATVPAQQGDRLEITQELGTTGSLGQFVIVGGP